MKSSHWYHSLNHPLLTPPDWIFPAVWNVLYLMIFISLILFVKSESPSSKFLPAFIFAIQLILNFSWTPIFFGAKNIGGALIVICILWISILALIVMFYKYSKAASILLIPYFLWVSFALYLNFEFFRLNG